MNLRRLLWTVVVASLAMMAVMMLLNRQGERPGPRETDRPSPSSRPATASAPLRPPAPTSAASAPTTVPSIGPGAATTAAAAATRPPPRWRNDSYEVQEALLGSLDKDSPYCLQVQLTSRGAAIYTVKLKDYFTTVADLKRFHRDPDTYQQAVLEGKELKGHYSLMTPVGLGGDLTYPLATERVGVMADKVWLTVSGPRWRCSPVTIGPDGTQEVTFTTEILRDGRAFLRLDKTYSLKPGSYSIGLALKVENLGDSTQEVTVRQLGPAGVPREDLKTDMRTLAYGHFVKGDLKVAKVPIAQTKKATPGLGDARSIGRSDGPDRVEWIGATNKFFASLLRIYPQEEGAAAAAHATVEFFQAALPESPESLTWVGATDLKGLEIPPGGTVNLAMDLFAGPKKRDLFDGSELYRSLHYKETLDFGSCCTWAPLTLGMMWLLDAMHRATFGNYGLAIILLVFLVRLALHPLTKKGQVSMMRMQKLQPEMTRLREKYKDDKAKLNEEMVKLYKGHGAAPMLLGCLPMALQMPIWVALWTGLSAAVELRHAPLLPFWITDLAAPDSLIGFGGAVLRLPLIDHMVGPIYGLNLLPILLTVGMVLQQKITPTAAPSPQDQQARTQRQMMYFMTGFFMLIFYNAPSGLTLYIMASTFAGVAEGYVIRKHIRQKQAEAAATETRVEMPGGRFRGQKPKKPKGPFRF